MLIELLAGQPLSTGGFPAGPDIITPVSQTSTLRLVPNAAAARQFQALPAAGHAATSSQ